MGKKAKRKMKKHYSVRRMSSSEAFFQSRAGRVALFFSVIAGVAAVVLLSVFVVAPLFDKEETKSESTHLVKNPFRDSLNANALPDAESYNLSSAVKEAKLELLTAIDPYIYKNEVVFTTSSMKGGRLKYDKLYIYDCEKEKETQVENISVKYDNILFPCMNDNYIVFLDSSLSGGGRVCVYDRNTKKQTALKDYLYAAPKVTLAGNMLMFMQQAGDSLDRLYIVQLDSMETVAYRVFSGLPLSPSAVNACNGRAVYCIPYRTEDGFDRSRIYTLDFYSGTEIENEPGKLINDIKTDGENVAFLTASAGMPTDLYCLEGKNLRLISKDVVNFDMGSGFIAYTKDDGVYAYRFRDNTNYKLNSDISRAYLCSAEGNMVCFMDVTGGFDDTVNTIKYLEVKFPDA